MINIEFGGKVRGFSWGMKALEKYCDMMGVDVGGLDLMFNQGPLQIRATTCLLLAGMQTYSKHEKEVVDYDYDDVQTWLDEGNPDTLSKIMADFKESKYLGRTIQNYFEMAEEAEENPNSKKKE